MPRPRDPELLRALGRRFHALRTSAKWSQEQLAEAIGVGPNLVSYYENGRKGLSIDSLALAARALGVRLADLVDVEERAPLPEAYAPPPTEEDALARTIRGLSPGARELAVDLVRDVARRWPPAG